MADTYDIEQFDNEDMGLYMLYRDDDDEPVDMTGWSAHMQVRKQKRSGTALLHLSTVTGEITLSDDGMIDIELPVEQVEQLGFGCAYWDLRMTDTDGKTFVLTGGEITLLAGVTRDVEGEEA